jgi:hypothetical protein
LFISICTYTYIVYLFFYSAGISIKDILDIIEADDDEVRSIFIEPPQPAQDSEEDLGDDSGGEIDNLTGRQLLAPAEVVFASGQRGNDDNSFDSSDDDIPLARLVRLPSPSHKRASMTDNTNTGNQSRGNRNEASVMKERVKKLKWKKIKIFK